MKGGRWLAPGELYEVEQLKKQHADLLAACEAALDSLEYIERNHPDLSGYGVRQDRIDQLHTTIAKAKGEG